MQNKLSDLVLKNGSVYSVDENRTWAEAVAVTETHIEFVDSNKDVEPLIGSETNVIDLEGKMVLPVFISTLTDSPILVGLIPALEDAGWFLPQLFLAKHLEGKNRRLPIVLKLGILDRIPFLLLAHGAFFVPKLDHQVAIVLFIIFYGIKVFEWFGSITMAGVNCHVHPCYPPRSLLGICLNTGENYGYVWCNYRRFDAC